MYDTPPPVRCSEETLNVLSGLLREHVADAGTAVILSNFAFWKDTTLRAGTLPDRGRLCGGGVAVKARPWSTA